MGGEGHMLDMIRRLKDGKEASRLRRERRNDKLGRLRRDNSYFVWGTLIIMGVLIGCAVLLWAIFF